jgi:hypothetical protein
LMPDFGDRFTEHYMTKVRASGASQQVIDATAKQMQDFATMYKNPLVNAAFTFVEPFPIGFLMTGISAAVLRRKA